MILCEIKNHFIAVKTNNDLIGEKPGSKQVRFQRKVSQEKKNDHPLAQEGKNIYVPPFPKDLKSIIGGKAFYRLKGWRMKCNCGDNSANFNKKLLDGIRLHKISRFDHPLPDMFYIFSTIHI